MFQLRQYHTFLLLMVTDKFNTSIFLGNFKSISIYIHFYFILFAKLITVKFLELTDVFITALKQFIAIAFYILLDNSRYFYRLLYPSGVALPSLFSQCSLTLYKEATCKISAFQFQRFGMCVDVQVSQSVIYSFIFIYRFTYQESMFRNLFLKGQNKK